MDSQRVYTISACMDQPPFSPPSAPVQGRLQGPPAKRKFLAASISQKEPTSMKSPKVRSRKLNKSSTHALANVLRGKPQHPSSLRTNWCASMLNPPFKKSFCAEILSIKSKREISKICLKEAN